MQRVRTILAVASLASVLFISVSAQAAQPTDEFGNPIPTAEPTPTPTPAPTTTPTTEPTPTYNPPPPAPPVRTEPAPVSTVAPMTTAPSEPAVPDEPAGDRPNGMTLGFGFGYNAFPTDIDRLGQASARFRLPSGLTFEPILVLNTTGESINDGDMKNAENDLALGTDVRLPLASRGPIDLVGVGGVGLSVNIVDPDGGDNNLTTTSIGLNWGVSTEYWYSPHWCFSLTAKNSFVQYTSITQETAADDVSSSNTSVGLNWNPGLAATVHMLL